MTEYIIDWDESLVIDTFSKNSLREEIVRCRDCAYMFDWAYDRLLCKLWAFNDPDESESGNGNALYPNVKPDGFCAWGERRSE